MENKPGIKLDKVRTNSKYPDQLQTNPKRRTLKVPKVEGMDDEAEQCKSPLQKREETSYGRRTKEISKACGKRDRSPEMGESTTPRGGKARKLLPTRMQQDTEISRSDAFPAPVPSFTALHRSNQVDQGYRDWIEEHDSSRSPSPSELDDPSHTDSAFFATKEQDFQVSLRIQQEIHEVTQKHGKDYHLKRGAYAGKFKPNPKEDGPAQELLREIARAETEEGVEAILEDWAGSYRHSLKTFTFMCADRCVYIYPDISISEVEDLQEMSKKALRWGENGIYW